MSVIKTIIKNKQTEHHLDSDFMRFQNDEDGVFKMKFSSGSTTVIIDLTREELELLKVKLQKTS